MKFSKLIPMLAVLSALLMAVTSAPAHAEVEGSGISKHVFRVNSTEDKTDVNPGDGKCQTTANTCTLRAAIQESNAFAGTEIVYMGQDTYKLQIAGSDNTAQKGDLDITGAVLIEGMGLDKTLLDGNSIDRIFHLIGPDAKLTLKNLNLSHGNAGGGFGGSVLNEGGELGLWFVRMAFNNAEKGGAVYSYGKLYTFFTAFRNNTATSGGGAVYTTGNSSEVQILYSSLSWNHSSKHGGGIWNDGKLFFVFSSTVALNEANENGGGIYNTLSNATPTELSILYSTISQNTADVDANGSGGGGGVVNIGAGQIKVVNTILAGNHDDSSKQVNHSEDCYGTYVSAGFNLIGISEGCTGFTQGVKNDLVGSAATPLNAQVGTLANYGGPTETYMPSQSSPAKNMGGSSDCDQQGGLVRDQRGYVRKTGTHCDIGATEIDSVCAKPMQPAMIAPTPLKKLKSAQVSFAWLEMNCATGYNLIVREKDEAGPIVIDAKNISALTFSAKLKKGKTYVWQVLACNVNGCSENTWYPFKVKK